MRQYETKVRETEEIAKIVCNKCGREIPVVEGVPREDVLKWRSTGDISPARTAGQTGLICARIVTTRS